MIHAPLLFHPGTNISYSSVALNVLGDIVETIVGTTLGEYCKTHIFEPLGMNDTTLGVRADRQKSREVCLNLAGAQLHNDIPPAPHPFDLIALPVALFSFKRSNSAEKTSRQPWWLDLN